MYGALPLHRLVTFVSFAIDLSACLTGSHIPDAIGSIVIGGLLGTVATFMIWSNTNNLVGRWLEIMF